MFEKADSQISHLNMILGRLIPENDLHTRITHTDPRSIYVIPDNLMTFKIPCFQYPSPCRINVKYLDMQIKGVENDLKVWVSKTDITPKDQKCEQKLLAPSSILVAENNKKYQTFRNFHYIYLSLYSQNGINIRVSCKFIDVNAFRKRNMLMKTKKLVTMDPVETERHNRELREGFEQHKHKHSTDFITVNKLHTEHAISTLRTSWEERVGSANQRKDELSLNKKKKNLAHMIKWEYVRKCRAELMVIQNRTKDKLDRATTFTRAMVFFTLMKRYKLICEDKIAFLRLRAEVIRKLKVCLHKFFNYLLRSQVSFDARQMNQARCAMVTNQSVFGW